MSLRIGTWPIEPGQTVWVETQVRLADGTGDLGRTDATWERNAGANSYWHADLGPYADGDVVEYTVCASAPGTAVRAAAVRLPVGPKLYLALLWHQHQPLYEDLGRKSKRAFHRLPWVRLHALRDYYAMAALLEEFPGVHLTVNLTPVLVRQIEAYADHGATDRALELTLRPAERLTSRQREELLASFFEASWHTQIYPWPRYRELFEKRRDGQVFSTSELRDLQMWFNLAWFGPEFHRGEVVLPDGTTGSVRSFVEKGREFSRSDVEAMVEEQRKVLRGVTAIHRSLQERGQIEVSTTPFYHPILPLLVDTDHATIDRPLARRPERFSRPSDAMEQVERAIDWYRSCFSRSPRGMWPAEGAVGQSVLSLFTETGMEWIATDRGVLERSGAYGYRADDPRVLCQPYQARDESGRGIAVFFRDPVLSDRIGFHYQGFEDAEHAAREFLREVKERFAWRMDDPSRSVLCIALDGENAWGAYPGAGRPFLRALYRALETDVEIRTVTFGEYLVGNPTRRIPPHPLESLARVHDLFHASWIDEAGSEPGNDLGTWIGEPEENRAWDLLREAGKFLDSRSATPQTHAAAFEALWAAEGSDWFWWFGDDQASESDAEFDDLFRAHLSAVYRAAGQVPPRKLQAHIVPHALVWTFARPIDAIRSGDRLVVRTNCPGRLEWRTEADEIWRSADLIPAGGVMTGVCRFGLTLGPYSLLDRRVEFRFLCTYPGCGGRAPCCAPTVYSVRVAI